MKVNLTAGRVTGFRAGADGKQALLCDSTVPGLGVRATAKIRAFINQGRINGNVHRKRRRSATKGRRRLDRVDPGEIGKNGVVVQADEFVDDLEPPFSTQQKQIQVILFQAMRDAGGEVLDNRILVERCENQGISKSRVSDALKYFEARDLATVDGRISPTKSA